MEGHYFGHSGVHCPCPHFIKVCITRKGNDPEVFERLAQQAGPKPFSCRRDRLSKKEQAARLYVMWGMPQKYSGDTSVPVFAADYFKGSLVGYFIRRCVRRGLNWVILSPKYGIWGPGDQYLPEEKLLRCITPAGQKGLAKKLGKIAARFEQVWLYSGRIHDRTALHKNVIAMSKATNKIQHALYFADVR